MIKNERIKKNLEKVENEIYLFINSIFTLLYFIYFIIIKASILIKYLPI